MLLLSKGIQSLLLKPYAAQAVRSVAPAAGLHTSESDSGAIGNLLQYLRFNVYHDIRHHLDNDKWAKIFAVEGNVKSGKGAFAEEFARKLELKLYPSPHHEYVHTCHDRFREEDLELRLERYRKLWNISLDRTFTNREDWPNIGRHQIAMIRSRHMQYRLAMSHILRHCQGVVLERSFYSLIVFHSAFEKLKLVPKEVIDSFALHVYRANSLMLPPQVVIYLDVPPDVCLERIQKHGTPAEKHISLDYLKAMDEAYKEEYLPAAAEAGSNVIHLDWTNPKSVDEIIMELDDMPTLLSQFNPWDLTNWELKRMMGRAGSRLISQIAENFIPVEEMWDPAWRREMEEHMENTMPPMYLKGYDPKKDKFVWLK